VLITKNHAPGFLWMKIFLRLVLDGIAGAKFFFSGDFEHCFAVLKAHFSFYGMIGAALRKRKSEQQHIASYSNTCIYNGNIVKEYFLSGKKKFSDLDPGRFN
jgi:hypothetical protein